MRYALDFLIIIKDYLMRINIKPILVALILITLMACDSKDNDSNPNDFNSPTFQKKYLELGHKVSEESFNAIRLNLMTAMAANGVSGAVEFCKTAAYPITDSLSELYSAKIRRTSIKYRNPLNKPDESELEILNHFGSLHDSGTLIKDSIIKISDKEIWYVRPIYAQGLCQNCHGSVGNTVSTDNYDVIKKLYPEDKAVDYKSGDLRGMWSIKLLVDDEDIMKD